VRKGSMFSTMDHLRIVLLPTSAIAVNRGAISSKRAHLVRRGIARELYELLAQGRVSSVHCPLGGAIVRINVDL